MINLTDSVGKRVHVQFKRGLLFIGAQNGHLGPIPSQPLARAPDGSVDPNAPPPPPMITDQLSGVLRKTPPKESTESEAADPGGQFILTYPNPATEGSYLDVFLDTDNIAAAWTERAVVLATPGEI